MDTTTDRGSTTLIRAADIPKLDRGGVILSPLATGAQGATEVMVQRGIVPDGLDFPAHYHDREEVLVLLGGAADATLGDDTMRVEAGDVLIIPAETVHSFVSRGSVPLEAIGITPAGARTLLPDGTELPLHGE